MNLEYDALSRAKRRKLFFLISAFFGLAVFALLVWALRELILPAIVGALAAYLCHPLLARMRRYGVPKAAAILLLFTGFFLIISLVSGQIRDAIPDEQGKLELRVRIQFKLNEKYQQLMQVDDNGKGNLVYSLVGSEIEPFWQQINSWLILPPKERQQFEEYYRSRFGADRFDQKYYRYFLANIEQHKKNNALHTADESVDQSAQAVAAEKQAESSANANAGLLAAIGGVISLWMAAPFVFLFLLLDEGEIKRSLVMLVPNRYFEMVLTVIHNVDDALGRYLRGTFLECTLVGFTLMVGLFAIGFGAKWAFVIGTLAGLANAIPFLGPGIGLLIGLIYGLVVEEYTPLFSFITADSMFIWVLVVVGITQLLDNAVYQPVVLGNAVSLHPLVVIIGVMGGSILLGFTGMLFAIPVIVVLKVVISTLIQQMKAYQII